MGGGSDVFVWVFVKGHALIHSRNWEGHDFFRQKFLKYPGPPLPIKNVPSLTASTVTLSACPDAFMQIHAHRCRSRDSRTLRKEERRLAFEICLQVMCR